MRNKLLVLFGALILLIGATGAHAAERPDGGYAVFDGTDDYMAVNGSASLNTVTAITLGGWVKTTDPINAILEYRSGPDIGVHLWSFTSPYSNMVDPAPNSHFLFGGQGDEITPDQWHMVMAAYDKSSGTGTLFLDGKEITTQNLGSFDLRTSGNLYFGFRPGAGDYLFKGSMDEVTVYNRALSESEVIRTYGRGLQGLKTDITDGLVGYWSFDDDLSDSSGNNNHGTAYGGMSIAAAPAVAPEPLSSVLFMTGGSMLGMRRFRHKLFNILGVWQ